MAEARIETCGCGEGCCVNPANCPADAIGTLLRAARSLMESVHYDTSGINGQGGNGGLISTATIRRADELHQVLLKVESVAHGH
jgi:hypothetical protein